MSNDPNPWHRQSYKVPFSKIGSFFQNWFNVLEVVMVVDNASPVTSWNLQVIMDQNLGHLCWFVGIHGIWNITNETIILN
jgi:hypothetical protein